MSKIKSERMKNRKLNTSFGQFTFDSEGITDVPEEHVHKLLALKGYKLLNGGDGQTDDTEGDQKTTQNGENSTQVTSSPDEGENTQNEDEKQQDDDDSEGEDDESDDTEGEELDAEKLDKLTVPQLKKIAKEREIDLNGASKKDEIIAIIIGSIE